MMNKTEIVNFLNANDFLKEMEHKQESPKTVAWLRNLEKNYRQIHKTLHDICNKLSKSKIHVR